MYNIHLLTNKKTNNYHIIYDGDLHLTDGSAVTKMLGPELSKEFLIELRDLLIAANLE